MKAFINSNTARLVSLLQGLYANCDLETLSLPGGSLIVIISWIYASTAAYFGRHSVVSANNDVAWQRI